MAESDLLEKLRTELVKDIDSEVQVVYILSRIRKILEINNLKSQYKYLNFYCNWALHSKIDRAEPVADILREFLKLDEAKVKFLTFEHLFANLVKFLKQFDLPEAITKDQWFKFCDKLIDIYSDTPIEVYPEEKVTIRIRRPAKEPKKGEFSVAFEIVRREQ